MIHVFIGYNFTDIFTIYRQVEFTSYQADVFVQNYKNFKTVKNLQLYNKREYHVTVHAGMI
jgi:hypothetical protein